MGAVGYIVDHDDTWQANMRRLARDGIIKKLLCNKRVKADAAPGVAVSNREV